MKYLAIYWKPLPGNESDISAFESHGWEAEADSKEQALEILERRFDVPFRVFLCEVIPAIQLEDWQKELESRHRVKLHC